MNEQHPLYLQILEELVNLDQREGMPPKEQRLAKARVYLERDVEEPQNPIQSISDATGGFDSPKSPER